MPERLLEEDADIQPDTGADTGASGLPKPPHPGLIGLGALALAACSNKAMEQLQPIQPSTLALEAADIPALGARELIPCTELGDNHPNVIDLGDKKILLFSNAGRIHYIYFDEDGICRRHQIEELPEGDYSSAIIYFNVYSGNMQLRVVDATGQILETVVEFDFGGNLEAAGELTPTDLTTDPRAGIVRNNVGYVVAGQMGFVRDGVLQLQNLQDGNIIDTEISLPDDFANCGLPHTDGISVGSYLKPVGDSLYMCTLIYSDELATLYELRQEIPGSEHNEGQRDPRVDGDSIVYVDNHGDEGLYRRRKNGPEEGDGDDDDDSDDDGSGDDDSSEEPDTTPQCPPTLTPPASDNPECAVNENIFQGQCTLDIDLCEGKSVRVKLNGTYSPDILEKTGRLLFGSVKVDTNGGDFDTAVNRLLIDGLDDSDYGAELDSLGELLVYCTEGQTDIFVRGQRVISLHAGDYARFDADSGAVLSNGVESSPPAPLEEAPRDYLFDCRSAGGADLAPLLGLLLMLVSRQLRHRD